MKPFFGSPLGRRGKGRIKSFPHFMRRRQVYRVSRLATWQFLASSLGFGGLALESMLQAEEPGGGLPGVLPDFAPKAKSVSLKREAVMPLLMAFPMTTCS